ncbi:MAG TPA: hypothetical protein VNQ76_08210 [Planctomicrobium sp.]|nr:hypothetical protein [Planctomicrobium sp.]
MKSTRIYIALSIVGLFLTVGIVLQKKVPKPEWDQFFAQGKFPPSLIPAPPKRIHREENSELETDPDVSETVSLEPIGNEVQDWTDLLSKTAQIRRLESVPWERNEIDQALRNFRGGSGRLIPPDSDIFPFPVELGEITAPIVSFRKSPVVIGLVVDPAYKGLLPKVSGPTIEGYLDQHALALQATVYRNQEGASTFAGPVEGAFFAKKTPGVTVVEQSLIKDAVRNVNLLGALEDPKDHSLRTLVLSFSYQRDLLEGVGAGSTLTTDYELLFLHLVKDEARILREPEIAAFATTEGRKNFIQLKPSTKTPNIVASIRFERFERLGIYPADPVVTGVKCQSASSTLTDNIRGRLQGDAGLAPIGLPTLLDEIHQAAAFAGTTRR